MFDSTTGRQRSMTVGPRAGATLATIFLGFLACSGGGRAGAPLGGATGSGGIPAGAGGADTGSGGAGGSGSPFEPLMPSAYGAKIKNLMVGQPLTDAELGQLVATPSFLPTSIDQWMALPAWRDRLLGFFEQAFQQTQVNAVDYNDQTGLNLSVWPAGPLLAGAAEESFARTVLQLLDEGRPFTDVLTTRRFMLNPPLMSLLAYMDAMPLDDAGIGRAALSWLFKQYPLVRLVGVMDAPVPLEQMIDPTSPNFFHYYYSPTPAVALKAGCMTAPTETGYRALRAMMDLLFGRNPLACGNTTPAFTADDWTNWRMITVRPPAGLSEPATTFWNLPALRTATDLVVSTPRIGFMTTPAFFANWMTNDSNQMRVTMNQSLIVALGTSFDDRGTTVQVSETTSDAAHVQPGTPCYGCHQTLDPMRDFFRQSFNYSYALQRTAAADMIPSTATFTVNGSAPVTGNGVAALSAALAAHPRFPVAWAQKLCRFANSNSCSEDDPEFLRVVTAFQSGGYQFKTLVREMFSSPLVTFATPTKSTTDNGIVVGIQRRETLCASLAHRLGLDDVCGLASTAGLKKAAVAQVVTERNLAGAIPGDAYARGSEIPLMPHDPNLFFVSGTENLCALLAPIVVDGGVGSRWTSSAKDAAENDFVSAVMAVPPLDERAAPLRAALDNHFVAAMAAGATATDALRSTFVLACTSPVSLSSGL